MRIDVFSVQDLDLEEYSRLQREAFREILARSGISDSYMNPEFFRWKYAPPAGSGKIAVAFEGNTMVAANAMLPLKIRRGTTTVLGWQSCDTATVPKARGKGYFMKCLNALEAQIERDQIFFGFPNKNSKRGFIRLGWKELQIVPTFIKPFSLFAMKEDPLIEEIDMFDQSQNALAEQLTQSSSTMIYRDAAYLNWRYHHPVYQYSSFVLRKQGICNGFLVLRTATIMGRRFALIMEIWGTGQRNERQLFSHAKRWALKKKTHHIALIGNRIGPLAGFASGYFLIPSFALPKQQVLMGSAKDAEVNAVMSSPWIVQTGDWDGF